jgi:divalent metal cation (Fe/Co/Zn/Cd) transporter
VALNIMIEALGLVRRSADGLMDHALEPEVVARIDAVLAGFREGAVRIDHVATRRAGARRFVDLHLHLPTDWPLGRAAAMRGTLEQALMNAVPGLRASIQLLPLDVEAHSDDTPQGAA